MHLPWVLRYGEKRGVWVYYRARTAALQPVSASFNPVVTLVERALGRIGTRTAAALIGAQVLGGLAGTVAANLMFGLDAVSFSTHGQEGARGIW
ncbi:hypothetical protein ACP3TD_01820 [Pseudarthrobacter sp. 1G09]|uniref:hypothetical protein n=1 Tax=Pseudarthrobacter sp. 1G09 TaxID=3416178 RepID=UPI003CEA9DF1